VTDKDTELIEAAEEATGVESSAGPATYAIRRVVCWALAVLLVVLVAATVTLGSLLLAQHQREVRGAAALDVARQYAITLTTSDQGSLDKNFSEVMSGATGEFKDGYGKAWSQMRKMLIDNKVATKGTVLDGAVKAVRGDDVDVLLSVKQDVSSAASDKPKTDYISMSMTMHRVGDQWLAAQVLLAGADGKRAQ